MSTPSTPLVDQRAIGDVEIGELAVARVGAEASSVIVQGTPRHHKLPAAPPAPGPTK